MNALSLIHKYYRLCFRCHCTLSLSGTGNRKLATLAKWHSKILNLEYIQHLSSFLRENSEQTVSLEKGSPKRQHWGSQVSADCY